MWASCWMTTQASIVPTTTGPFSRAGRTRIPNKLALLTSYSSDMREAQKLISLALFQCESRVLLRYFRALLDMEELYSTHTSPRHTEQVPLSQLSRSAKNGVVHTQ